MDRNKSVLHSHDQILWAARSVYQIVKLLRLTRQQYLDMFEVDVLSQLDGNLAADERLMLLAFARGVRDTYLTVLLTEHCTFVWVLADGRELDCKGVVGIDPSSLAEATCGYSWTNSDFPFGEFSAVTP